MKLITYILSITFLISSCALNTTPKSMKEQKINFLIFHFQDASVPPDYHRSYTLTFEQNKTHLVVDSYGDVITDTMLNLSEEDIRKIFSLIEKYNIKNKPKNTEDKGCTGGTGISIKYGLDKDVFCDGYVYFCGGTAHGDLNGDLQALENEIIGMIPNFNSYLKN
jgi:hypothetical protein